MEQISPYALTTLQRVKDLLFDPNSFISLTGCSLINNSTNVTGVTVQTGKTLRVGQTITGTYIPSGTTIAAIISATQITLSQNATSSQSGQVLAVTDQPTAYDAVLTRMVNSVSDYIGNECGRPYGFVQRTYTNETYSITDPNQDYLVLKNTPVFTLTSFQWRAGTPSNPNWTDFIADQYELVDPETDPITGNVWYPKGIVRVYGVLPGIYSNMIRATYTAGYPVNWANAGDHNTHLLPDNLTGTAENLVVRKFTRRQLAGKSGQSLMGANESWRNEIDAEDLDVIAQYRQLNF